MKLWLMAYQMAKDWDVATTAKMCREGSMASFEYFAHPEYKQGVGLEMPADARKHAKAAFQFKSGPRASPDPIVLQGQCPLIFDGVGDFGNEILPLRVQIEGFGTV